MVSRRRGSAAVVLLAGVLLAACGQAGSSPPPETVSVVAEFSLLADFAEGVGGDRIQVVSVVPIGGDPHVYEPRPGDAVLVAEADLVLEHGLGLSPWMRTMRTAATGPVVTVADPVASEAVLDEDGVLDPHLWLSPVYAGRYVEVIADAFAEIDPAGARAYEDNARVYLAELAELDRELQGWFDTVPAENRKLVTPHDAYRYFAEHFGLEITGTLVGITTEEQPSAETVRELVDAVRDQDVPAVFTEATVPSRVIERVARDAGVEIAGPLYGDSVGAGGSGAEDYIGMLRWNARVIVEALGGTAG